MHHLNCLVYWLHGRGHNFCLQKSRMPLAGLVYYSLRKVSFYHVTSTNKIITMQYKFKEFINNKCSPYNSSLSMYSSISNMFQHDIHHRNSLTIIQPFIFQHFASVTGYDNPFHYGVHAPIVKTLFLLNDKSWALCHKNSFCNICHHVNRVFSFEVVPALALFVRGRSV